MNDGKSKGESRIALITGGAGGLGLATAERLAGLGYTVAVADLNAAASEAAAEGLAVNNKRGQQHMGIGIDVTDEMSVGKAFEEVERRLGPVAVLVTVAGVIANGVSGGQSLLTEITVDEWDKTFAVNAKGTFLCIREYARRRTAAPIEDGRVITVASSAAQIGGYQARSAYCASKGAVLSLTKEAARELAPLNITVNSISPGPMDTPLLQATRGTQPKAGGSYDAMSLIPLRRIGLPEEFAAAVAYLASVDAAYATGSTLDLNGGSRMQ